MILAVDRAVKLNTNKQNIFKMMLLTGDSSLDGQDNV